MKVQDNNDLVIGFAIFALVLASVLRYIIGAFIYFILKIENLYIINKIFFYLLKVLLSIIRVSKEIVFWIYWCIAFFSLAILMSWRMAYVGFVLFYFFPNFDLCFFVVLELIIQDYG